MKAWVGRKRGQTPFYLSFFGLPCFKHFNERFNVPSGVPRGRSWHSWYITFLISLLEQTKDATTYSAPFLEILPHSPLNPVKKIFEKKWKYGDFSLVRVIRSFPFHPHPNPPPSRGRDRRDCHTLRVRNDRFGVRNDPEYLILTVNLEPLNLVRAPEHHSIEHQCTRHQSTSLQNSELLVSPNPFREKTVISYQLSVKTRNRLPITDYYLYLWPLCPLPTAYYLQSLNS